MPRRLQRLLAAHGALVFLAGLIAGFPFALLEIHAMSVQSPPTEAPMPGDVRGWRMAHLEGILNGLLCFAGVAVGPYVRLSERGYAILAWTLIVTAWFNTVASIIGPLLGGRGLVPGISVTNTVMYVLFLVAVVAVIVAMVLVYRGARAADADGSPRA